MSKYIKFTKKGTYEVGDEMAFCNANKGKSKDFYTIKYSRDTVIVLSRYNLVVENMAGIRNLSIWFAE